MIGLLDVLKNVDFLTGFTEELTSVLSREALPEQVLRRRLLLCLFALGTNMGIKRLADGLAAADPNTTDTGGRAAPGTRRPHHPGQPASGDPAAGQQHLEHARSRLVGRGHRVRIGLTQVRVLVLELQPAA